MERNFIKFNNDTVCLNSKYITYIEMLNYCEGRYKIVAHAFQTDKSEFVYAICDTLEEAKEKMEVLTYRITN